MGPLGFSAFHQFFLCAGEVGIIANERGLDAHLRRQAVLTGGLQKSLQYPEEKTFRRANHI